MRASTKMRVLGETAQTMAPTARTTAPSTNVRRRPKSSATVPVVSNAAARPMLIELRIQVRPAASDIRSSAVLLIVASGAVNAISVNKVPDAATASARVPFVVPAGVGAVSVIVVSLVW